MRLDDNTPVKKLLDRYPFLIDFLANYASKFRMLKNPVLRGTIGRIATLGQAARIGDVDLSELLRALAGAIKERTGETVAVDAGGEGPSDDPAGRKELKIEILKGLIEDLHQGAEFDSVKRRFTELVRDVSPGEIAAMEQRLIADGMPETEVKRLCDVHVQVFKEALERQASPEAVPGHPVHTFRSENEALGKVVEEMRALLAEERGIEANRDRLLAGLNRLAEVEKHYLRKEHQLFPYLEKHDLTAPPKVMWEIHDDIRALFKSVRGELGSREHHKAGADLEVLLTTMADMIYKEDNILFPMSLETLTEAEWAEIRAGEDEIGYALVTPGTDWPPAGKIEPAAEKPPAAGDGDLIPLEVGGITRDQINLIFGHLPVEITFVDENDQVRYYSRTREKLFSRSPGIIGRKVQNCHPPDSIHMVDRILAEFRAGARDVAEFWMTFYGKFVHIRYFAVRDAAGKYMGTMEVSQDITGIKELQGEKRLLDWD